MQRRPRQRRALLKLQKRQRRVLPVPEGELTDLSLLSSLLTSTHQVASTEAPILHERGSFAYDVETARSHHVHARQAAAAAAAAAAAPFSPQFAQEIPDGLSRYPTPSSSHPYTRYYQTTTPWAAYPDDVDYTAMSTYSPSCYAVAAAAHESPYASFRMAPSARSALYGDASAAYPAVQHHHHHHQQHRPPVPVSVEPQSSSMSLSSVAAALPPTMDRMLPALSAKGLAPGYHHHLDPIPVPVPVSAYAHAKSASSSPDASPTDSVHYAPAYDASPVSSFTQATSLAGSSSHRESASTGCGSDSYASSTGTGSGSLYADAEPLSRSSLPDYALRGSASRRESDSYSLAGPQGYTMHAGPIPSPSIAGRGLHQAQAQAAAAAAAAAASSAYMISGSSAAANASSDPSTSPHHDQGENDAGLVAHHDMHRTRAAPSLSAA